MKKVLILLAVCVLFACTCFGQSDKALERVPEWQKTARLANGGALGCGSGTITLITSNGELSVRTGLDPIHVFGKRIEVSELLLLLDARVNSNTTGLENPMSGNVSDLAYVVLSTLGLSKDASVIPTISKLLDDKDDVIRGWSAIALIELAGASPQLQKLIEPIQFPKAAVLSARGRGIDLPSWASVRQD